MKSKTVYVDGAIIGAASSWGDVAELLGVDWETLLRRPATIAKRLSEGPSGFFVERRST